MANLTSVGITSGVPSSGTGTVSTLDNLIGSVATPSASVLTLQGVSGGAPVAVSGTFWQTTQPVSVASLPAAVVFGPTADGTAAANPPVLVAGTVDGTGTGAVAIPKITAGGVVSTDVSTVNAITVLTGAGATGTGAQRVGVAQDTTTIAGSAPGTAGTASAQVLTVQGVASMTPLLVNPGTAASWGVVTIGSTTSGQSGTLAMGAVTTAAPTYTTAQSSPLSLDTAGNLRVNVVTGGGTGGTSLADEAAFTEGTTVFTPMGGVFKTSQTALTTGQAGAVALSAAREMNTLGKVWDGTNTAAVKAASTAPVATDPAIVVAISPNSVNANGSAVSASSAPVVIASDQVAVAVKPAAAATGGATNLHFFSVTGTPTATAIKASAGTLYGVQAVNTGAAPVYLKIYNTASGSVTVGTTVPLMTIPVPTVATTGAGIVIPFPVGVAFGTAISWALTNVAADNDATAVAVGVTLNIQFA